MNFTRWRATIARLQDGRYAAEAVLDFLQNKDNKAIVITTNHIIYINTHRQRIRWAFSIRNLTSVAASGKAADACIASCGLMHGWWNLLFLPVCQIASVCVPSEGTYSMAGQ